MCAEHNIALLFVLQKCDLKIGSPFKPFWDHLNVDFDSTESYNITYASADRKLWSSYYPAKKYPVLAMKGAPASFPIQPVSLSNTR